MSHWFHVRYLFYLQVDPQWNCPILLYVTVMLGHIISVLVIDHRFIECGLPHIFSSLPKWTLAVLSSYLRYPLAFLHLLNSHVFSLNYLKHINFRTKKIPRKSHKGLRDFCWKMSRAVIIAQGLVTLI